MGGSGSGGWMPSAPRESCQTLSFVATLNSPQPSILSTLNIGDFLEIVLAPPPHHTIWVLKNGEIGGALTGSHVSSLIHCIQNGFNFEAEVISILGGSCTVMVAPK